MSNQSIQKHSRDKNKLGDIETNLARMLEPGNMGAGIKAKCEWLQQQYHHHLKGVFASDDFISDVIWYNLAKRELLYRIFGTLCTIDSPLLTFTAICKVLSPWCARNWELVEWCFQILFEGMPIFRGGSGKRFVIDNTCQSIPGIS